MGNKFNNNIPKDVKLAISFEGELIRLYLRNKINKWANIGVASQFYLSEFSVIASALFGILAGLILNYFLSVSLVFKK